MEFRRVLFRSSRAVRRERPLDRVLRRPVGNPPRLPQRLPAREQRPGGPAVISNLLRKKKDLSFERSYNAPVEAVWQAWTEADRLRRWWGPEKTTVGECEVDLRIGGRIYVVPVAGEEMGKYAGPRWTMDGTLSRIEIGRATCRERGCQKG